jgi:hypothetical protein
MKSLKHEAWTPRFLTLLQAERDAAARNRAKHGALYDLAPGTVSADEVAVVGQDGFLFVGNGSNRCEQQCTGQYRLSDQGLGKWRVALERRQAAAADIGARYLHLVIPEKQNVFPTARWPVPVKQVGPQPIDQLAALAIPVILYPLQVLQFHSWRAEIAWRGDSHYCASGMWFIFAELMSRLWPQRAFRFDTLTLARTWRRHDLARKFTDKPVFEDVISLVRQAAVVSDNRLYARTGKQVGNRYVLGHPAAPHDECIVVFGDSHSFEMGLTHLLSTYFKRVHFVWDTAVDFEYCRRVGATLVLTECAERYLIRPPRPDVLPGQTNVAES